MDRYKRARKILRRAIKEYELKNRQGRLIILHTTPDHVIKISFYSAMDRYSIQYDSYFNKRLQLQFWDTYHEAACVDQERLSRARNRLTRENVQPRRDYMRKIFKNCADIKTGDPAWLMFRYFWMLVEKLMGQFKIRKAQGFMSYYFMAEIFFILVGDEKNAKFFHKTYGKQAILKYCSVFDIICERFPREIKKLKDEYFFLINNSRSISKVNDG